MINTKYQEDNKRLVKNSAILSIRLIIMMLVGLYTSRVVLEVLGVEDYGIYNVVAGFVAMFSIFTTFFVSSCQRFLSYAIGLGDFQRLKKTFSTIQLVTVIGSVLLIIITLPLTDIFIEDFLVIPIGRLDAARFIFISSVLTLALTVVSQPYVALITAHERIDFFSIMSIAEYVLKLLAVILLKYINFGVDNLKLYALLLIAIAIIIRISYSIYCHKHFEESSFCLIIDKPLIKEVFSYSFWVGTGAFGGIIKDQGGNILLNIFYGVSLNAAKGVSQQVLGVINQIGSNLMTPISPQITKSYAAGDINRSISLTFFLAKIQGYVVSLFSIPIILEADYILEIWLKNPPQQSSLFVRWSLVLCILQVLSNAYGPLYLAIGKLKRLQVITFFVNITILPFLYVVYKLGAPAIAVLYCTILFQIITMVLSYSNIARYIDFPLRKFYVDVVFKLVTISSITLLILFPIASLEDENSFAKLLLNTIVSMSIFSCLTLRFGINSEERGKIIELVSKIKIIQVLYERIHKDSRL